jgi:hypothetical protein
VPRRLLAAFAAVLLAVAALPAPAAAFDNGSNCDYLQQGNWHIFLAMTSPDILGQRFEGAKGTATVRDLGTCENTSATTGFNAVLPANIEFSGNGKVIQLGYLNSGLAAPKFVYAYGTEVTRDWPGTFKPVVGRTYTFTIAKDTDSAGNIWARFSIRDLTLSVTQTYSVSGWPGAGDGLWSGYEQQNQRAYMGIAGGQYGPWQDVNLTDIGYERTNATTWYFPNIYTMFMGTPALPDHYFNGKHRCGHRSGSGSSSYFNVRTYTDGYNCTSS